MMKTTELKTERSYKNVKGKLCY